MENSKLHAYFSQNVAAIHIYVIIKLLAIQAKIGTRLKKTVIKIKNLEEISLGLVSVSLVKTWL